MTRPPDDSTHGTHLTVYLPGLFGAPANDFSVLGPCHALETLLVRSESAAQAVPAGYEQGLFALFGLPGEDGADLPVAAVTRMLDMGVIDNEWWLRADPVHLSLEQDRLILADAGKLDISQEEANRLVAEIMEVFTADGWLLKAPRPDRWYLKPGRAPVMVTTPLSQAIAHDVHPLLPRGTDGKAWHTTLNEIQILLHTASVNAEREKRGKLPINSLWFWGGGRLPRIMPVPWTRIWSNEPVTLSLARLSGTANENAPDQFSDWRAQASRPGRYLLVLDQVHAAAQYHDGPHWAHAMRGLEENWMTPLLQALKANVISSATLLADNGARFSITSRQARRWWRFRRPLATYHAWHN